MKVTTATALEIGELKRPVVTAYQLGVIIFSLYTTKTYQGKALRFLKREAPQRGSYNNIIKKLIASGVLNRTIGMSHPEIFSVLSQRISSAGEAACCVNPFCYVSHLSAMEYHGFTDRLPKMLFMSEPNPAIWKKLANERMEKDLGSSLKTYIDAGLPRLRRLHLKKITRKTVNVQTSAHYNPGAYITVQGTDLKVSSIGRTFLDMIRYPSLCGGIYHVLDIYSQQAERYLRLIVEEVQQHGTLIDKVRVGYILDERLGLSHPIIDTWKTSVQRGGSRKLSTDAPYAPVFSEKWNLSINIEDTTD